jgi:hypothetical protein
MTIVVAFVTFNIMWGHISISFLNISSISPTICNLMSKVSTIKTMTINEIYIPGVDDLLYVVFLLKSFFG